MTTIIGRIKGYDTNNVIVSVPGQKDKIAFIEAASRATACANYPPGTEVRVMTGDKKATIGTVINIEKLTPEEIISLAKKELTVLRNEVPGETSHSTAASPTGRADFKELDTTKLPSFAADILPKKKEMVPDVNVSVRDALIAQQSCLNRAVEIYEISFPVCDGSETELRDVVNNILTIKDELFKDIWLKSGMPFREKKE
jgi:hypothetical protein